MRKPKFLKTLTIILVTVALALSLTSCGGMTLEKLLLEVDTAMEGKEITQGTIAIALEASLTAEGETQDIVAELVLDVMNSAVPYATFIDMELDADVAGESFDETMQLYIQEEEGTVVNYVHIDSMDIWTKMDTEQTVEDYKADISGETEDDLGLPEDLALAEETQIVDNREVYVLTGTFNGEELLNYDEDTVSEAEDVLSELGLGELDLDLDFSSITIPATIYVDMETYIPIRYELEVQGLDELIDGLLDTVMDTMISAITGLEGAEDLGVDTSELEADMSTSDISIDVTTCKLVFNNLGYDSVEVPTVPEEGKEEAKRQELAANQHEFEAAQDDGSYIIQESGYAVRIAPIEGFTTSDYTYNYVYMIGDNGMQEAIFTMYTDMISEDFAYYVEQIYVPTFIEEEIYVSHGAGPKIGEFETMYIECIEDIMIYYAWAPVGDGGFVDIEMYDYEGNDLEKVLTPIIETVEEYQL